jgi:protein gp37
MKNSTIEWCDHTFNAWEGCTKVSPGCANCYAETRNQRYHGGKHWGPGAPRLLRSDAYWKEPLKWNRDLQYRCLVCGATEEGINEYHFCKQCELDAHPIRQRVFCSSLADWLDEEGPVDQLGRLLRLIHDTPNLDWLLLTKRPENWRDRIERAREHYDGYADLNSWLDGTAPPNVWIGTTVENQEYADKRIPELLKIPAKVRFLSCEPLLGPVVLPWRTGVRAQLIHWVIVGGESGAKARPIQVGWARSLQSQCFEAGVPFFFKQFGEFAPKGRKSGVHASSDPGDEMVRVGKKAAGRLLDGREWNEFPEEVK